MPDSDTILSMRGVTKSFGGVRALRGVDLEVKRGEVHALIGENGAGKSTLVKILSGALRGDNGEIVFDGGLFEPRDPLHARRSGIAMVYQELNLAPHLTIEENLTLGIEESRFGVIRRGIYRERIERALSMLHHPDLKPEMRVLDLSPGARQLVEIARGLIIESRVFVLDEPTSSLSHYDTEHLFEVLKILKNQGVSIIYISHFLEEIKHVADRFTVLRDGETVGVGDVRSTPTDRIIEMMVGRSLTEMFPRVEHEIGEELFSVGKLKGSGLPVDVSFSVRRGEIFGIAGLVGAGRTETLRTLFGLLPRKAGDVRLVTVPNIGVAPSPHRMINAGVSLLSEDRKNEGLALTRSIAENITFSILPRIARMGIVGDGAIEKVAERSSGRLSIKLNRVTDKVESLSGGNQQKAALARLLEEDGDVFLLDEPTRGVDVGSKVEIFRLIGELAKQGKAVIIVSSYLPELLGVCDTIAVMHRGVLGDKRPVGEWDEYTIMNEATSGIESIV